MSTSTDPATQALVPIDPTRRLLETRIEHATSELAADLNRASLIARRTAATVGRGLVRAILVGAVVVLGLLAALRRRPRRLRFVWK